MMKVALIGAGGLAREIISCFKKHVCFVEVWDDALQPGSDFYGMQVKGSVAHIPDHYFIPFVIAIGNPLQRKKIYEILKEKNAVLQTLIHPEAVIHNPASIQIEEGCVLMPSSYLTTDIHLEENVLLHIGAGVHHDVVVKSNSVLMPGSRITCGFNTPDHFFLESLHVITISNKHLYM